MKPVTRLVWAVAVALVAGLVAWALQVDRWISPGTPPRLAFAVDLSAVRAPDTVTQLESAWTLRLRGRGPAFVPGDDPAHLVVTVDGTRADVDELHAALTRSGKLGFHEVINDTPTARTWYQRAHAHEVGPDVDGYPDAWTDPETGATVSDFFLTAPTAEALDAAVAQLALTDQLPLDVRVVYEQVEPRHQSADPERPPYVRTYVVAAEPALDGRDVAQASVVYDPNTQRPQVRLTFTRAGAERFADLTGRLIGHKLAIVLDGVVNSAPVILGRIPGGVCVITMGDADPRRQQADASALVRVLRAGAELPAGIQASLRDSRPGARGLVWLPRLALAFLAGLAAFVIVGRLAPRFTLAAAAPLAPGTRGLAPTTIALLLTLGLPTALILIAPHLPLPGVDQRVLAAVSSGRGGPDAAGVSVFTLGVMSMLTGFWLVELVAALTPRWRTRRLSTPGDRRALDRAALVTGLVVATLQAYFVGRYLQSAGVLAPGGLALVVAIATAVAGVAFQVVLAEVISRRGLVNGYVALLAVGGVRAVYRTLAPSPWPGLPDRRPALVAALAVLALLVVASTALRDRSPQRRRLPWIGIVPVAVLATAAGFLMLVLQLLSSAGLAANDSVVVRAILEPPAWLDVGVAAVATAGLILARRLERTALGLAVTLGVAAGFLLVHHLTPTGLAIKAWTIPIVLLTGFALEGALALRARLGLAAPVVVLVVHDVDRADRAADALVAAGVPASVEGLRTRAILRGLGAFAPIVLRVAAADLDRAIEVIAAGEAARAPALAAFAA